MLGLRSRCVCSVYVACVCECFSCPGPYDLAVAEIFSYGGNVIIERVRVLSQFSWVLRKGKERKRKPRESKVFFLLIN